MELYSGREWDGESTKKRLEEKETTHSLTLNRTPERNDQKGAAQHPRREKDTRTHTYCIHTIQERERRVNVITTGPWVESPR